MVMCGVMIAWVSWQSRVEAERPRALHLAGIFLGLALALLAHMWAMLVPGCFVMSAIARRLKGDGVLDRGALAAMMAPWALLLSYRPIVAATRQIQFEGEVYNSDLIGSYDKFIGHWPIFLLLLGLFLIGTTLFTGREEAGRSEGSGGGLLAEDTVLALCLVLVPVTVLAITNVTHSAFMTRYGLVATLGLSVLLSQLFTVLAHRARGRCYAMLLILGLGLSAHSLRSALSARQAVAPNLAAILAIPEIGGSIEPIVYGIGTVFLETDFVAPAELAKRMVYVADPELAARTIGTNGVDSALIAGREYLGMRGRMISYAELRARYRSFWLVDDSANALNWISEKLRADRAEIRALAVPGKRVAHVTLR